jgi:outer membrane protein OmpA-like peptidoglycan-associated protein
MSLSNKKTISPWEYLMKKGYFFLLSLLISIPACGPRKKAANKANSVSNEVNIPVAQGGMKSVFDEDLGEFTLVDDSLNNPIDQYAWIENNNKNSELKPVYFGFNEDTINTTQEPVVAYDANQIQKLFAKEQEKNPDATLTIVVEGHACHSAGSALYNMALSEKRAKALQDRLVASGISRNAIKIVGRGQEVPAVVNGAVVTGNREQQAPNRRYEIRITVA